MSLSRIATIVLCFLLSHAAIGEYRQSTADLPLTPFCDVLNASKRYDGMVVRTSAIIYSSEHEVHLRHEACQSTAIDDYSSSLEFPSGWTSTALGKKLSKILRHHRSANVEIEVVFQGSGGPYGQEKDRFHFVLRRLKSVRQLPK